MSGGNNGGSGGNNGGGDPDPAQVDVAPAAAQVDVAPAAPAIRRLPRRATTQPVPGSDPRPAPEPERHTLTENDDRLKAEKPPHY